MKKVIVFSVLCLFVVALVGCSPKINKEEAKKVYMGAVDAWAKDYVAAKPDDRGKVDFQKYLDEAAKKNGATGWTDYATKAATAMGAEEWTKCATEFGQAQADRMKKVGEDIAKQAQGDKPAEDPKKEGE